MRACATDDLRSRDDALEVSCCDAATIVERLASRAGRGVIFFFLILGE